MTLFYFGLVQSAGEHLIGQGIHNEEAMVLCQLLIHPALVVDGAVGQGVPQVVSNNLLYGRIGVETEAQYIVQVRPADSVEDTEFLCTNDGAEVGVTADGQEFAKCLGVLTVQHIVQDM